MDEVSNRKWIANLDFTLAAHLHELGDYRARVLAMPVNIEGPCQHKIEIRTVSVRGYEGFA